MSQIDRAEQLAEHLEDDGIEILTADLLDALACLGLKLEPDPAGESSKAYFEVVGAHVEATRGTAVEPSVAGVRWFER